MGRPTQNVMGSSLHSIEAVRGSKLHSVAQRTKPSDTRLQSSRVRSSACGWTALDALVVGSDGHGWMQHADDTPNQSPPPISIRRTSFGLESEASMLRVDGCLGNNSQGNGLTNAKLHRASAEQTRHESNSPRKTRRWVVYSLCVAVRSAQLFADPETMGGRPQGEA